MIAELVPAHTRTPVTVDQIEADDLIEVEGLRGDIRRIRVARLRAPGPGDYYFDAMSAECAHVTIDPHAGRVWRIDYIGPDAKAGVTV